MSVSETDDLVLGMGTFVCSMQGGKAGQGHSKGCSFHGSEGVSSGGR